MRTPDNTRRGHLKTADVATMLTAVWMACGASSRATDALDSWTIRTLPDSGRLQSIAFGNGSYVAVGWAGMIITSSDGTNWTRRTRGGGSYLRRVRFGNGMFVAVGQKAILTSADTVNWTSRSVGTVSGDTYFSGVAFGAGRFLVVGSGSRPSQPGIWASSDGQAWTNQVNDSSPRLSAITFVNGKFIGVGGGTIATSADGIEWSKTKLPGSLDLRGITQRDGMWIAVGATPDTSLGGWGSLPVLFTSSDGVAWTQRSTGSFRSHSNNSLVDVTWGGGMFVAFGGSYPRFAWQGSKLGIVATSRDGVRWDMRNPSLAPLEDRIPTVGFV